MTEKQIVWYILLTEVKIDSDTQSVTDNIPEEALDKGDPIIKI